MRRRPLPLRLGTAVLPLLALVVSCGQEGPGPASAPAGAAGRSDPVSGVRADPQLAELLPAAVRRRGSLRIAASVGTPPAAFRPDAAAREPVGLDIDIADAVARVLGVRPVRQEASFEAILPALESGKFDVGTGNFGVTRERLRTTDFVTYVNDGQGFAVRRDDTSWKKVTDLRQLCGRNVGVGAGTTFEATLRAHRARCGRNPYDVKVYSENAASLTALQQGRLDIVMSTINGLRHQAAQEAAGTRFLGEYRRLDVGFALRKDSPLARPLRAAVEKLIADGTYARILKKWGTGPSALKHSRINPPEYPDRPPRRTGNGREGAE